MWCAACASEIAGTGTERERCERCGADPILEGRYALDAVLGRGARGTTWRARDLREGRVVAIKETQLHALDTPKARALVQREGAVLRQLHHRAIPRYIDEIVTGAGRTACVWLIQEHVDGQDLQRGLAHHRYTEREVLEIIAELSAVLVYLHGLSPPVVHRDLKPANVLRKPTGELVLVDFGAVRDVLRDPQLGGSTVAGTFGFMAPEQFAGDASPKSDLYGLGALAVALLSRKEPRELLGADGRLRFQGSVSISAATTQLLEELLALDPADRPRDALTVQQRALALLDRPALLAASPPRDALPASAGLAAVSMGGLLGAAFTGCTLVTLGVGLCAALLQPELEPEPGVPATHWPVVSAELYEQMGPVLRCPGTSAQCPAPFAQETAREDIDRVYWIREARPERELLVEASSERALAPQLAPLKDPTPVAREARIRLQPGYPLRAFAISLPSVRCRARLQVAPEGMAQHVAIDGCPLVFHEPLVEALAQWRWEPGPEAFLTEVTLGFEPQAHRWTARGTLHITSDRQATITVDGELVGSTPLRHELPQGLHTITATSLADPELQQTVKVEIEKGMTSSLSLSF